MYPTPMYRAAISRTALPTALAGMTPPVCAARAGVGAGGGGGGSAVTVIATVSKVQVAPAGTCTTGAVVSELGGVVEAGPRCTGGAVTRSGRARGHLVLQRVRGELSGSGGSAPGRTSPASPQGRRLRRPDVVPPLLPAMRWDRRRWQERGNHIWAPETASLG